MWIAREVCGLISSNRAWWYDQKRREEEMEETKNHTGGSREDLDLLDEPQR